MKVNIGPYKKKGGRKVKVEISGADVWSLDNTLALIILPCLKKYQEDVVGYAFTKYEDFPGEFDDESEKVEGVGSFSAKRWEAIVGEMIWAFEQVLDEDAESKFFKGEFDREGYNKWNDRVRNGLILFGKYFQSLWI